MKLTLPEKKMFKKRQLFLYIAIMMICMASIIIAFYVQFYARIDLGKMVGISDQGTFGKKTETQTEELKSEFDQIFTNTIENQEEKNIDQKKEVDKEIVYAKTEKKESKLNSYDIEVHIPYINLDEEIIQKYNQEIEETFLTKTQNVLKSENKNVIYTVEYVATIQNDILSLMIRSNLKEGSSAQRVIIQTYNYDLRNHKEITLEEVLKIQQLDKNKVQEQIKNEVSVEQKKVEDLKKLGYNIYSRDTASDQYLIEKSTEFYLTKDTLYIIYAYGNSTFTSEMDLVIL